MPLKLTAPIEQEFVLERTDAAYNEEGEDATSIGVAQASTREHEMRSNLWAESKQEVVLNNDLDEETIRYIQRFSAPELRRLEARLTLTSCNIQDEKGKDLFKFKNIDGRSRINMSPAEFATAWGKLPLDVTAEISEKVLEVNVSWRPRGE